MRTTPIMNFGKHIPTGTPLEASRVHETTCPGCQAFRYRFIPGRYTTFTIDCVVCDAPFPVT